MMNGFGLIFRPDGTAHGELYKFTAPVTLDFLREAVGGDIELVPGFDRIGGRACHAFCNEHGKLEHPEHTEQMVFNLRATLLWEEALAARGDPRVGLRDIHGDWIDWLVGPVLVLYGDDEFMAEL